MTPLTITRTTSTEQFVKWCAEAGHPLPWDVDEGEILDLFAHQVADLWNADLALLIVLAVNTCGGFQAELQP